MFVLVYNYSNDACIVAELEIKMESSYAKEHKQPHTRYDTST